MISYLAAMLAAVINATSSALNRKAAREAPDRGPALALLVLPAAALIAGATALIGSPRLQALQAAGMVGPAPSGPGTEHRPRSGGDDGGTPVTAGHR